MFKRKKAPLYIVVSNGRWDAFGEPTRRNLYLKKILDSMGGVNENVPNGRYIFDVKLKGLKIVVSLDPIV